MGDHFRLLAQGAGETAGGRLLDDAPESLSPGVALVEDVCERGEVGAFSVGERWGRVGFGKPEGDALPEGCPRHDERGPECGDPTCQGWVRPAAQSKSAV